MTAYRKNASAYIPGECNINETEAKLRWRAGYIGLVLAAVVLYVSLYKLHLVWWRLMVAAPVFLGAVGFLQASKRFCVYYSSKGMQNAEPGSTRPHTITSDADLHKDRQRSRMIILQAVTIAIVVSLLSLLLPAMDK